MILGSYIKRTGTYITIGRPIKCWVRTIRPVCSICSTWLPVLGFILLQLKFRKTENTFSSEKKLSVFIKIARVYVFSFFFLQYHCGMGRIRPFALPVSLVQNKLTYFAISSFNDKIYFLKKVICKYCFLMNYHWRNINYTSPSQAQFTLDRLTIFYQFPW